MTKKQGGLSAFGAKTVWSSLPLFPVAPDSTGSVSGAPNAKRPLAVRRETPRVPNLRMVDSPAMDGTGMRPETSTEKKNFRTRERVPRRNRVNASFASRLLAGTVDVLLLILVDATVVALTAWTTGTSLGVEMELPMPPLLGFLVLFDFGSVIVLTAVAGQTIGKMIVGIRVVGSEGGQLTIGQVIARTIFCVFLVLPAGIGMVGMLFGSRRALHDRLAGTEVVFVASH